jgi:hypothetical protein
MYELWPETHKLGTGTVAVASSLAGHVCIRCKSKLQSRESKRERSKKGKGHGAYIHSRIRVGVRCWGSGKMIHPGKDLITVSHMVW